jgi:hypothetical protein
MRLCLLTIAAVLALLTGPGCSADGETRTSPSPTASLALKGLVFAYGIGARNVLDTRNGTFTKDMILASPMTVPLQLTPGEMARVAQELERIDFFSYPREYETPVDPSQESREAPAGLHHSYRFAVTTERGTKVVVWQDKILNDDERAAGLRALAHLIEDMIIAKPEYLRLPPPQGGYV